MYPAACEVRDLRSTSARPRPDLPSISSISPRSVPGLPQVDFVDINMGCPIDVVCNKGCGAQLATRHTKVQGVVRTMSEILSCPLTLNMDAARRPLLRERIIVLSGVPLCLLRGARGARCKSATMSLARF